MTGMTIKRALGAVATVGALGAVPLVLGTGTASAQGGHDWSGVAQCESGGNWSTNTGNGYYGGLQFSQSTWEAYGGSGSAHNASQSEQIRVAENVLAGQGAGAWPTCGQYLTGGSTPGAGGYTDASAGYSAPAETVEQAAPVAPASGAGNYIVRAGDTLSAIAAAHGVAFENLAAQVADVDLIYVGQSLNV